MHIFLFSHEILLTLFFFFFFFNDTATTEIYTLSLHDALPILGTPRTRPAWSRGVSAARWRRRACRSQRGRIRSCRRRSEEHTSELQSLRHLVCRLLLEKKKKIKTYSIVQRTKMSITTSVR